LPQNRRKQAIPMTSIRGVSDLVGATCRPAGEVDRPYEGQGRQRRGRKLSGRSGSAIFQAGVAAVLRRLERLRQRRALHRLDDHLLSDIGLSRAEAERELSKPFRRF
jgi:uncharacterized protein YjiS (DUF1127 family)